LYLEGDAKLEGISLGAMELNTPMWQIESRLDDPEIQKDILPKLAELGKSGLYLYDHKGAISAEQVFNSINYMIKGLGCDVIVLDNLSITIAGDSGEQNERKMIDTLVYKIVKLIQETGACILNVVHAVKNRKTKDGQDSEKITRSDIHGSGAFAKFSNSVFAIEREESEVNLKVLANRFKGIDGYMDTLQYNASTGRLEVIESVIGE
jgi:twinkle protein